MPINNKKFAFLDLETGGLESESRPILEICCIIYDPRTLSKIEGAKFVSKLRPSGEEKDWNIHPEALAKNKITIEEIRAAPPEKEVWNAFVAFLERFDKPIIVGQNVKFDIGFINAYNGKYKIKKKLFAEKVLDLMDVTWFFFENTNEVKAYGLDYLRDFMGISKEGAHRAEKDIEDTALIFMRFMGWFRRLYSYEKFDNCFGGRGETGNKEREGSI